MLNNKFRRRRLKKISSPEALNDYLQVTTPAIWMVLVAALVMLVGIFVWASSGYLETTVKGDAKAENQTVNIIVLNAKKADIKPGMTVRIGEAGGEIESVSNDNFGRSISTLHMDIPDGNYEAEIVTEKVHPISFLFND